MTQLEAYPEVARIQFFIRHGGGDYAETQWGPFSGLKFFKIYYSGHPEPDESLMNVFHLAVELDAPVEWGPNPLLLLTLKPGRSFVDDKYFVTAEAFNSWWYLKGSSWPSVLFSLRGIKELEIKEISHRDLLTAIDRRFIGSSPESDLVGHQAQIESVMTFLDSTDAFRKLVIDFIYIPEGGE